ncbi:MAG TPA: hypothetical protein VG937_34720 [Polyangiaceae bacterium]|nr:hypothetical protein [Polyangiaceae bacterium]
MTWLRNSLSVLSIAALTSLAASGCEENESMLFIKGVLAIETTNCVAKPESGGTLKAFGRVDTSLANGYVAALLVGSQLTQRGSREQLRTETARLTLEGAEITLNDAAGNPLPIGTNPFTSSGTGFVDPAGGTQPGFGAIFVEVIPAGIMPDVATALGGGGVVQAKIRVFGTTLGGQAIESGDYTFSVEVCNGCLISYPTSADSSQPGQDFECGMATSTSSTDTICAIGQDQVTPCTLCSGASDVCLHPCSNCAVRANPANSARCMNSPMPECP